MSSKTYTKNETKIESEKVTSKMKQTREITRFKELQKYLPTMELQ